MSKMSGVHVYQEYDLYWYKYITICQDVRSSFLYCDNYRSNIRHSRR